MISLAYTGAEVVGVGVEDLYVKRYVASPATIATTTAMITILPRLDLGVGIGDPGGVPKTDGSIKIDLRQLTRGVNSIISIPPPHDLSSGYHHHR